MRHIEDGATGSLADFTSKKRPQVSLEGLCSIFALVGSLTILIDTRHIELQVGTLFLSWYDFCIEVVPGLLVQLLYAINFVLSDQQGDVL